MLGGWSVSRSSATRGASALLCASALAACAGDIGGDPPVGSPPPAENAAPTVVVAPVGPLRAGDRATLRATATDDGRPSGGRVTVRWTRVRGPDGAGLLPEPSGEAPTVTLELAGEYVYVAAASDGERVSGAQVVIEVLAVDANAAPVVLVSPAQSIALPSTATLTATVTDDGRPAPGAVTLEWTVVSGPGAVTFSDPARADTAAAFAQDGRYVLRLRASDGELSGEAETTVDVAAAPLVNVAPSVRMGAPVVVQLPALAALTATVTDDGLPTGALTVAWSMVSGPGATTFGSADRADTAAAFSAPGAYVVRLTASDGDLTSAADLAVDVRPAVPVPTNQAPSVSAGPDVTVTLPAGAALGGVASDDGLPAGSALTLAWSQVSGPGTTTFADPAAAQTSATFSAAGTYVLRLRASDGALAGQDEATVTVQAPNMAPVVSAGPAQTITLPASATLMGSATDDGRPAGASLTYAWTRVAGPGTIAFANAAAAATTATFSADGTHQLRLTVSDSQLSAHADVVITVRPVANQRPTANAGPDRTTTAGVPVRLQGSGSDDGRPAGSSLTYAWARISGAGAVTADDWSLAQPTVTFAAAGTHRLRLTVSDGALSATDDVDVVVSAANTAPTVSAGADVSVTLPASATLSGSGSDDGLPSGTLTYAWSAVSGPGTVTFASASSAGTTATFSAAGAYVLRLTASDGALSASDDVAVTVSAAPPVNQRPTVSAGADVSVTLPASATLSGSGSDDGLPSGTLTYAWSAVSGPGTVTFASASSAGTTATFSAAGAYVLRLTASDGALSASDDVAVTVSAAPPVNQRPTVSAGADVSVTLPASATLSGSGSDDGLPSGTLTYAWSAVSGPGTVTFASASSAGTTATFSAAGAYVLRLTASDGALSASDDVAVTVSAAPPVRRVLMFVAYNDVWWPEYKVMYEGLRAAGFTVDVRSSATGFALADYSTAVSNTPSAQGLDASYTAPSSYATFTGLFATNFGTAWNVAWDPIANIPLDGRIQDVADLSAYEALVIPGGRGMVEYRYDGTYSGFAAASNPGHATTAAEVQAAAERLNALAQEALAAGKPVAAQCHGAPTLAFVRVPGSTGGYANLGRSVLAGRAATGYAFNDSDTVARYADLGVTLMRSEKVVVDGPEAPDFGGNGRDLVLTSADWYPETAAYATRTLVNLLDTTPSPARRTRRIRALVFGGDEPTLYAPEQPLVYTDLAALLNETTDDLDIVATPTNNPADMSAAALANYDVLVYFRHNRITAAQQNAIVQWVDGGGGFVGVHHAAYDEGAAQGTLLAMLGSTLPSSVSMNSETGLMWTGQSNHLINVNYGHFVSTWGVYSASGQPAQSVQYTSPRGVPNANIDNDGARGFWSFRIPANDELYLGLAFMPGVTFGRGANQIERLFSNDRFLAGSPDPNNGAHDHWGYVKRYDGNGDGVVGRVVYLQPGETLVRTLAQVSYRQVIKNAVVWSAR